MGNLGNLAIESPAERIEILKAMWAAGEFLSVIGERLGLSRGAVAGKIHRLKLPKRGRGSERRADDAWNDEDKIQILKTMWAAGDPIKVIARAVGRTPGAVLSKALRLGFTRRDGQAKAAASKNAMEKRVLVKRLRIHPNQSPVVVTHAVYEGVRYEAPVTGKTLLELGPHDCRWPCWNAFETDQFFCAAPQLDGKPYCPTHCAIAYAPTQRLTSLPRAA